MRDLSLQTGIGTDANFLNGNLVDLQTKIDEGVNQDLVQLFQKLADLAVIIPNGDPDNEANGYQLIDALIDFNQSHGAWQTPAYETGYAGATTNPLRYRLLANGMLQLNGNVVNPGYSGSGLLLTTLPAAYSPVLDRVFSILDNTAHGYGQTATIQTDGQILFNSAEPNYLMSINEIIPLD